MDALSVLLEDVQLFETRYCHIQGFGDWSYAINSKDTILFYLVLSGSFCINVGGEVREANTGDTIMISNAYQHICYALNHHGDTAEPLATTLACYKECKADINKASNEEQNASLILIECRYEKDMMQPLLSVLPTILPELSRTADGRFDVIDVEVKLLTLESEHKRMGKTAVINHWASIMMIECLRTYVETLPEATDNWLLALKDPYLSKALAAMHDVPDHNWTIHKLAEVAGMSRSSFAQRFKDVVGVPPLTYLIDYRLRLAARYLRRQQYSISRISELVGYASDSTFSQAFKRVYGMSPKAYRQEYQEDRPRYEKLSS